MLKQMVFVCWRRINYVLKPLFYGEPEIQLLLLTNAVLVEQQKWNDRVL